MPHHSPSLVYPCQTPLSGTSTVSGVPSIDVDAAFRRLAMTAKGYDEARAEVGSGESSTDGPYPGAVASAVAGSTHSLLSHRLLSHAHPLLVPGPPAAAASVPGASVLALGQRLHAALTKSLTEDGSSASRPGGLLAPTGISTGRRGKGGKGGKPSGPEPCCAAEGDSGRLAGRLCGKCRCSGGEGSGPEEGSPEAAAEEAAGAERRASGEPTCG